MGVPRAVQPVRWDGPSSVCSLECVGYEGLDQPIGDVGKSHGFKEGRTQGYLPLVAGPGREAAVFPRVRQPLASRRGFEAGYWLVVGMVGGIAARGLGGWLGLGKEREGWWLSCVALLGPLAVGWAGMRWAVGMTATCHLRVG